MSSKRRFDRERFGPARNTRSRVAERRWAELSNDLWCAIAVFLPLSTYALLSSHLLPHVVWKDDRKREAYEIIKRKGAVEHWKPVGWVDALPYLLRGADSNTVSRIDRLLFRFPFSLQQMLRYMAMNHLVEGLAKLPRSSLPEFCKITRLAHYIDTHKQFEFFSLLCKTPIPGLFCRAFLLPGCWQAVPACLADSLVYVLLDDVARFCPGVMVRWFGPRWKEVYKAHPPGLLKAQIFDVMNTMHDMGLLYGWLSLYDLNCSDAANITSWVTYVNSKPLTATILLPHNSS